MTVKQWCVTGALLLGTFGMVSTASAGTVQFVGEASSVFTNGDATFTDNQLNAGRVTMPGSGNTFDVTDGEPFRLLAFRYENKYHGPKYRHWTSGDGQFFSARCR